METTTDYINFSKVANEIYEQLQVSLPEDYRACLTDEIRGDFLRPDLAIYKGGECIAVMDITTPIHQEDTPSTTKFQNIRSIATKMTAKYAVLSDGTAYWYWASGADKINKCENLNKFILLLKDILRFADRTELMVNVCQKLADAIENNNKNNLQGEDANNNDTLTPKLIAFFRSITADGITPDCNLQTLSFTSENEYKLFNLLVPSYQKSGTLEAKHKLRVCRYTSLESLFYSLASHSFRLNALAGMNDKGERTFLYRSLYRYDADPEHWKEDNITYIMSCSDISKEDKLEMWRLYANDAMGVCIEYEVDEEKLKDNFQLRHILYDRDVANKETFGYEILNGLTRNLKEQGIDFRLQHFELWKSFVKSGDYAYEAEVRLYYKETDGAIKHSSKDWVITDRNKIINPFVSFYFCDEDVEIEKKKREQENDNRPVILFPLRLKRIILGPKCPEQEENRQQIFALIQKDPILSKQGLSYADIQLSAIQNYR